MVIKVYSLVTGCKCRSYNRRSFSHLENKRSQFRSDSWSIKENLLRRASVLIKVEMFVVIDVVMSLSISCLITLFHQRRNKRIQISIYEVNLQWNNKSYCFIYMLFFFFWQFLFHAFYVCLNTFLNYSNIK